MRAAYLKLDDECLAPCPICGQEIEPGTTFWHDDDDVFHGECIGHSDTPIPARPGS